MWLQTKPALALIAVALSVVSPPLWAQGVGHYLAPRDQIVAIRAGHLFDSHNGHLLPSTRFLFPSNPAMLKDGGSVA